MKYPKLKVLRNEKTAAAISSPHKVAAARVEKIANVIDEIT